MTNRCDKCLTRIPSEHYVAYAIPTEECLEKIFLCTQCNHVFDNRAFLLLEFLKEDYGTFPIHQTERSMIDARKRRSTGDSPWTKTKGADI